MKPEEALEILRQVGANFQGNLQDHNNIQQALSVLSATIDELKAKNDLPKEREYLSQARDTMRKRESV